MKSQPGTCKMCGCTDNDCRVCIRRTGAPCHWINDHHTICSACVEENKDLRFLNFLTIDYDASSFDSAMWYELDMSVDLYLSKDIHARINGKIDFFYLVDSDLKFSK